MSKSLYERLHTMLVKLKATPNHPVWTTSLANMGLYISRRLRIETATGQPIDETYVARLESYMPKPRPRATSAQWRSQFDAMQQRAVRAEELGIKLLAFVLDVSRGNPASATHVALACQFLTDRGIEPRDCIFHTQDASIADARSKFYDAAHPQQAG